ncbi:MAG: hypothetical protein NTZ20_01105 [Candidatus Levybacteria bacterium]|nr:hypothetical protein [Candidatus Levybacteria bacterium]
MSKKILFFLYGISIISLFFYSFTQVDLGLTFTRHLILRPIQGFFQDIGYFNRPLSTYLYIGIMTSLFFCYFYFIKMTENKLINRKEIWYLLIISTIFLSFSYNMLSYDLFNYVFDAKIFTNYNLNPYMYKALDFPGDPMLSFMHWTHRVYPYGPIWLAISIVLSYAGLQFLAPTLIIFKLFMAGTFIGTLFYLEKIFIKLSKKDALTRVVLFGFNPLVVTESLVSAHHDIVMIFFAVASLYFIFEKRYLISSILLLFSIGIKFATIFIVPAYIFIAKKQLDKWYLFAISSCFFMAVAILFASFRTEFQPWYLLWIMPFSLFLTKKEYIIFPFFVVSIILELSYVPYLFIGNWDAPIPVIRTNMYLGALFIIIIYEFLLFRRNNKAKNIS